VAQFVLLRPLSALQQPWQVQVLALCMAVFSTVVPIWLVTEAIRRLGAGTASMIGSLGPIITIGLASALLGERLGWAQVVGALIVVVAVTWLSRSRAVI
jgi:drug/metabolite transporter (DMT)-like permease